MGGVGSHLEAGLEIPAVLSPLCAHPGQLGRQGHPLWPPLIRSRSPGVPWAVLVREQLHSVPRKGGGPSLNHGPEVP